jgi:hypothetical protein
MRAATPWWYWMTRYHCQVSRSECGYIVVLAVRPPLLLLLLLASERGKTKGTPCGAGYRVSTVKRVGPERCYIAVVAVYHCVWC